MQHFGAHSRVLNLTQNIPIEVFSVNPSRDDATTWLIEATNTVNGTAPVITLQINEGGPSGFNLPSTTEIGPGESVQVYVSGSVTITALTTAGPPAGQTIGLGISITAIGGGPIPLPPSRFTITPNAVVFLSCSDNNGYAPSGTRYFTIFSTVDYDIQFRTQGGGVVFSSNAILAAQPIGPLILPPGLRLLAKGNAVGGTINIAWTQQAGR